MMYELARRFQSKWRENTFSFLTIAVANQKPCFFKSQLYLFDIGVFRARHDVMEAQIEITHALAIRTGKSSKIRLCIS